MAERKFKHEEVAAVPRGYRVRTVTRGRHEIRVAFPPGPRRTGAGRVVSILHPVGENPACPIRQIADRMVNAGPCKCGSDEPAVFGGLCVRCAREKAAQARQRASAIRGARLNPTLVESIRPGDKVTILTPHGSKLTGRAVMRSSSGGWVLNLGGRHGTPGLAEERNIVRVRKGNPETDTERKARETVEAWLAGMHRGGHTASKKEMGEVYRQALRHYQEARRAGTHRNPGKNPGTWSSDMATAYTAGLKDGQAGKPKREEQFIFRAAYLQGYRDGQSGRVSVKTNPAEGELGLEQATELFEEFHGREPDEILEIQESDLARKDYTALGDLVELRFVTPEGGDGKITFEGDDVKVASSPNGRQLYLLGGNQDITGSLAQFGADQGKDFVDLGDAVFISYDASKWQTDFKPTIWEHKLGEESKVYPRGFFDKLKRRIFFAGGHYRVERPGIID